MKIGILALQGGYAAHAQMLAQLDIEHQYVRSPAELAGIQGLILPGGESSTALKLLTESGLFSAIQIAAAQGLAIFGTCAGAILMAKQVTSPSQESLGLVDVTVARNAYGRQLASCVTRGSSILKTDALEMVFIRAPRFTHWTSDVEVIAEYNHEPVCLRQNRYLLASFHPELTTDSSLHRYFIDLISFH